MVIYLPNTVSSTLFARNSKRATLAPPDQWFQGDDPNGSHNEIIWRLNKNRPSSDERGQGCDERGPENYQQHDQRDSSELARGGGGRRRHGGRIAMWR